MAGVYELGSGAIGEISGLWTPREVAIAGLREATGKAVSRPFSVGLAWLKAASFSVRMSLRSLRPILWQSWQLPSVPDISTTPLQNSGLRALQEIRSTVDETDPWRKGCYRGQSRQRIRTLHDPVELVVALSSRGIGQAERVAKQAA